MKVDIAIKETKDYAGELEGIDDINSPEDEEWARIINEKFVHNEKAVTLRLKGGSGSGNFSHEGRPGDVGGSAPPKGSWVHSLTNNQAIDLKASANEFKGIVKDKIGVKFSTSSYRYGGLFGDRNCRISFTGSGLKEEHVSIIKDIAKDYFGVLLDSVDDNTYYPTPDITIWFNQMTPEGKKKWENVIGTLGLKEDKK